MKHSIFGKILLTMIVMIAIAATVLFREAHRTGYELLTALAHSRAHSVADVGLRIVEQQMLRKDRGEITAYLQALAESQHANTVCIIGLNGNVVYSADSTVVGHRISLDEYELHPHFQGHRYSIVEEAGLEREHYLWPLKNSEQCRGCHRNDEPLLGYLGVDIPIDDIEEIASVHRNSNITLTIIIFSGLGVMLALALLVLISQPINRLKRHVAEVEKHIPQLQQGGTLPMLIDPVDGPSDEIGALAQSFRNLIERLNHAYEEVVELHHQQLERADQLASTGEMAASIAHEIKNPVSGVKAALQVFLRKADESDSNREIIEEMIVQLDRITGAVNDLLSYARVTPPEFAVISVVDIINRTIALLQPEITARSVALQVELLEQGHRIEGDHHQVQQVIWNIMLNAVQSMSDGVTLGVRMEQKDDLTTIRISDTGGGITQDVMSRIYKPFYTTKCKGSGLGMTIARRIMQQHGGGIHVQSKVHHGTTVQLIFPNSQP